MLIHERVHAQLLVSAAGRIRELSVFSSFHHAQVNGIPTLILLDAENGSVITTDGRAAISMDPDGLQVWCLCLFP